MEGIGLVEFVGDSGECDAWVETWLAARLVFIDYVDMYVFAIFLGISFSNNDILMFMLNNLLLLQEYLIRWPLSLLLAVYGPQGKDCLLYGYQLPCMWGQLLGAITCYAVLLSMHRRRITGYLTFFACSYAAFLITFAPLYRHLVTPAQLLASVLLGYLYAVITFSCTVWLLRHYGDVLVALPLISWFGFDNTLSFCVNEEDTDNKT